MLGEDSRVKRSKDVECMFRIERKGVRKAVEGGHNSKSLRGGKKKHTCTQTDQHTGREVFKVADELTG